MLDGINADDFSPYLSIKNAPRVIRQKLRVDDEMLKKFELKAKEALNPTTSARLEVVRSAEMSFDGNVASAIASLKRASQGGGRADPGVRAARRATS